MDLNRASTSGSDTSTDGGFPVLPRTGTGSSSRASSASTVTDMDARMAELEESDAYLGTVASLDLSRDAEKLKKALLKLRAKKRKDFISVMVRWNAVYPVLVNARCPRCCYC